jgi:CRISPR system Cascade subunit CasB
MSEAQEKRENTPRFYHFWRREDQQALTDWWQWLEDNRGERARLRRCDTSGEILPQSAFHRLCRKPPWWEQHDVMGLAVIAGLSSHVAERNALALPAQMGQHREGGDKPRVSELRFQQIISSKDYDELFERLRRAIDLLGRSANIISLADGVFHWSQDRRDRYSEQPSHRFHYSWSKAYFNEVFKYQKETTS